MIVCLGWGSLIWCQKTLPVRGAWKSDGPALPIEFARESTDHRITLVICDGSPSIPVLWAELDVATLQEGRRALAIREGVSERNIRRIGHWSIDEDGAQPGTPAIGEWAHQRSITGVVWTALGPKIGAEDRLPSNVEVIEHLKGLSGGAAKAAEEYVRLAPRQIVTPYRKAIEAELGWTPEGLI